MTTLAMNFAPTRGAREDGDAASPLSPALKRLGISFCALLATVLLGRMALDHFDAPVRELAITGALLNVQADDVRQAAAPTLNANLFSLDLTTVRLAIEQLPWVASARIDRQWPARLAIRITERQPLARWGEHDALSTEGVVFSPGRTPLAKTLPRLGGAPGREREVLTVYGQLVDRLSESPLALSGLVQDARGEWTGTTQGGISLRFGRGNPVEQVARLKSLVVPALATRLDAVQHIDLRYANGFAVGWRAPAAIQSEANKSIETPSASQDGASADELIQPGVTP